MTIVRSETPIVEVKNLNSFRNVELALEYEVKRQYEEWQKTGRKLGEVPQRDSRLGRHPRHDLCAARQRRSIGSTGTFPIPTLVPVTVTAEFLDAIRASLGELPAARRRRFECDVWSVPITTRG